MDTNSFSSVSELPETITVDILSEGGTLVETTISKHVLNDGDQKTSVYEYSIWSDPGKNYVLVPRDSRWTLFSMNMGYKILAT